EAAGRDRDRLPAGEVGDRRVDERGAGMDEEDDDEEGEAREPRRVRLPLEPVERLRERPRGDAELLDAVEAAAVDLPRLPRDAARAVALVGGRREVVVERDEVERRPDPRDRREHVQPAEEQVAPPPPVVAEA